MAFSQHGHDITSGTTCWLCFFWLMRVGILWYFCSVLVFPMYSCSLVRQEPWCSAAEEKSTFKIQLFYTRLRRNSVFFSYFSHCVTVFCPKQRAAEWGEFIAGFFLRWASSREWMAQWITVDTRRKRKQVMVTGKFHGCIERPALVVDPFLGNPLLTSLTSCMWFQIPQGLGSRWSQGCLMYKHGT